METMLNEKPYDFVPLTKICDKSIRKDQNTFAKGTYSGKLNLSIKALTPIHISQGILEFNSDKTNLISRTMRRNENVVIPGSSIKGVIRSIAEAVSHSCAPKSPKPKLRELSKAFEDSNKYQCNGYDNRLCPTCSMFGMIGSELNYRSKISFGEFVMKKGSFDYVLIPSLSSPFKDYPKPNEIFPKGSEGYGNERIYYCMACDGRSTGLCYSCHKDQDYHVKKDKNPHRLIKFRGRKFYFHNISRQETGNKGKTSLYETAGKDSVFEGSVTFENLTENELSILSFSLGLDKSFNLKLGYAKPAFYGSIEIKLEKTEDLLNRYTKRDSNLNNEFILQLAENYYSNIDEDVKKAIDKLREILNKNKEAHKWHEVDGNKVY